MRNTRVSMLPIHCFAGALCLINTVIRSKIFSNSDCWSRYTKSACTQQVNRWAINIVRSQSCMVWRQYLTKHRRGCTIKTQFVATACVRLCNHPGTVCLAGVTMLPRGQCQVQLLQTLRTHTDDVSCCDFGANYLLASGSGFVPITKCPMKLPAHLSELLLQ